MKLSDVGFGYMVVRMSHHDSHGHHHEDPDLIRCREVMFSDERAVVARVEVAVAKMASPVWRILAVFGIHGH